ncbi:glycoside hydrolase family 9 protein [Nonomuraea rhizosphaerae]|uniref:glycoside hydrolase family 9 protein n=1 Tax=Nonomuraea rhizosphaerae TaxID=2665663 RepID=UPI001FE6925C|nr:glycoside hydrolase family 9 protein [Nonomuraea rhizosphaerae]
MGSTQAVAAPLPPGHIRVDQVGFAPAESKHAFMMTRAGASGARFSVVRDDGREVLKGSAGRDLGPWNGTYGHVYELDLTALKEPGRYRVRSGPMTSPAFQVSSAAPAAPASKILSFFRAQRDGGRRHHNDRAAAVYDWPEFTGPDTDQIKGKPRRIGGPVDVEGGWFDAGDYLKFTHILAYVDTLMYASIRDGGGTGGGGADGSDTRLRREATHGLKYLDKMWDGKSKTLYIQVGIGAGDEDATYVGDHDVWRLPEKDDTSKHPFLRHRPVFRAADPGKPISPNLAGRTAAAFALAAQVETSRTRATALLNQAAAIYAMAKTDKVGRLVTSLPYAFYPESAWRDDMELGGAELALAALRLGDGRADGWLRQAAHWAGQYLEHEAGGDTFNLYDVSALAHADLIKAIRQADAASPVTANPVMGADGLPALIAVDGPVSVSEGLPVTEQQLVDDLRAQLEIGVKRAAGDPFRAGAAYDEFDSVPHAFGLAATSRLYRTVSGDRAYDAFGTRQRGWAFGANAWGVSFVAGAGQNAIRCPHYQISNITGRPVVGAVVNGPNADSLFHDGLGNHLEGMRPCPSDGVDRYAPFTGHGSRFVDDVRSWQASEPADDFAAVALYALTLMSD